MLKPIRWTEWDLNPYVKWVQPSQINLFSNSLSLKDKKFNYSDNDNKKQVKIRLDKKPEINALNKIILPIQKLDANYNVISLTQ